jgi:N-formylglutamate amidohydrolase
VGSPPTVTGPFVSGQTYFGQNGYIEFAAGDLPIIVSAPHGGTIDPAEIPNRTSGETGTDSGTEDLARSLAAALHARTGQWASVVICRLRRTKLDANRDIGGAAQGNPAAEQAWREYHAFIEAARDLAIARHGRGLVIDLHGHGHPIPRAELGYLLSASDLNRTDAELDQGGFASRTGIRALAAESGIAFSALLRGRSSLGGLLQAAGYPSVPAPGAPGPGSDPYFSGGYATERHGSLSGGSMNAVQIELPFPGIRDSAAARSRFAAALANALVTDLSTHARVSF